MKKIPAIQKLIASLLMLVFLTGSTPKAIFHDLIADHNDAVGCTIDHETDVLHQHETNCDYDDLVVHVPYLFDTDISKIQLSRTFIQFQSYFGQEYFFTYSKHKENRGPPSA